jgi:hypothetical protein
MWPVSSDWKAFRDPGNRIYVPAMQAGSVPWKLGNAEQNRQISLENQADGLQCPERITAKENGTRPPDMHLKARQVSEKVTKLSPRAATPVGPVPRIAATFTNRHKGNSKQYVPKDIIMNAYLSQHGPTWRYSPISTRH